MFLYSGQNDKEVPKTHRSALVISCGVGASRDHMTLRKNGRRDYSLFFVEKGKMFFDNKCVTKNQVWIYPPNVFQEYVTYKKDNVSYFYLHFTGNKLDELISSLEIPLCTAQNAPDGILEILRKIKNLSSKDDSLSVLKCEYETLKILSLLSPPKESKSGTMSAVIEEMNHSYSLPYDAKRFSDICALSESRFNHLFKKETGIAPQKYYNIIRMENAGILLKETSLPIKDVALKTGFSDPLYFGQAFKKFYGISPKNYRMK